MSSYPDLDAELSADPIGRGFAGMTDAAAAANLEDATGANGRSVIYPLDRAALNEWAASGPHASIQDVYNGTTTPVDVVVSAEVTITAKQIRAAAIAAWRLLEAESAEVDLSNPNHVALVDVLAVGGVITSGERTALTTDFATKTVSRADELRRAGKVLPARIGGGHVQDARAS